MKIIKIASYITFWILSYIIPKNKKLYLFVNTNGKNFSGNSKTLFLYIKKNITNLNPVYIGETKKIFTKSDTLKAYFLTLRAKYIFIENDLNQISSFILAYQPGNIKVVNLWHGEPIKKIGFDANEKSYKKNRNIIYNNLYKNFFNNKVIFGTTCSEISKKNLNTSQLTNKYKVTGLSRNEIFFDKNFITKNIKKDLNIVNKKIILYTPTYRDNLVEYEPIKINKKLDLLLENNNYILLIKAHQGDNKIVINENKNIINITKLDYDIQEIMYYSDILITDYSSIYIDFLLTDKTIIFYPFDIEDYLKNRNMYFKYDEVTIKETTSYSQDNLENIISNINNIINNYDYITNYRDLKNLFHKYQNGGYCKNILKELENHEKYLNNNSIN